jgi:hypothetical protein
LLGYTAVNSYSLYRLVIVAGICELIGLNRKASKPGSAAVWQRQIDEKDRLREYYSDKTNRKITDVVHRCANRLCIGTG